MATSKKMGMVVGAALASAASGTLAVMPARGALIAEYNFETVAASSTPNTAPAGTAPAGTLSVKNADTPVQYTLPAQTSNAAVGTSALTFAGKISGNDGNWVSLGTAGTGALNIPGAITLSAWVDLTSNDANSSDLISNNGFGGNRSYNLSITSAGLPSMQISGDGTTTFVANGTSAIQLGNYALVTGVYNPSVGVYVYVNGQLVGSNTTSIPAAQKIQAANYVNIGNGGVVQTSNQQAWVNGTIDDARIYNNALTASDVQILYNSAVPEPASIGAVLVAGAGLALRRRSRD